MQFIHKMTGKRYWVINAQAKDQTSSRDGVAVVVYCRGDDRDVPSHAWLVCEAEEFYEQFAPVTAEGPIEGDLAIAMPKLMQKAHDLGLIVTPGEMRRPQAAEPNKTQGDAQ